MRNKVMSAISDGKLLYHMDNIKKIQPKSAKKCIKNKNEEISKICEICGNVYLAKRNFTAHLRRHSSIKPFDCEFCQKNFYTNSELKSHMRSHTGEKPYECKHCHRRFSDFSTHKKHERTHTNDRPFSCNICEKSFTNSFILKNHILMHSGKRPYKCVICTKSFSHACHFQAHLKTLVHRKKCKMAEEEEVKKLESEQMQAEIAAEQQSSRSELLI